MSPTPEEEDFVDVKGSNVKAEELQASDAAKKQAAKRRTKTGCLTCRKRRIKCGEEKPVCKNCSKSKRKCAGYVQPLVYKQQAPGAKAVFHDPSNGFLPFHDDGVTPIGFPDISLPPQQPYTTSYHAFDPSLQPLYQQPSSSAGYHAVSQVPGEGVPQSNPQAGGCYIWSDPSGPPYSGTFDSGQSVPGCPTAYDRSGAPTTSFALDPQLFGAQGGPGVQNFTAHYQSSPFVFPAGDARSTYGNRSTVYFHQGSSSFAQPQVVAQGSLDENVAIQSNAYGFIQRPDHTPAALPPTLFTAASAYAATDAEEFEDPDDPFDVEMEANEVSFEDAADSLTRILDHTGQGSSWKQSSGTSRRIRTEALASFRPAMTMSPLQEEKNQGMFRHFVEITSHCISIHERHHFSPIIAPARTLWNFTIPALALSHPALAHALLALGGVHLAKLTNSSEDTAVKHFTYAIRRVGKLLGLPRRRHEIATLATILVLGFYEVISGDHSRWNLHLSGATKLVLEHDYAGMIRRARSMRNGAKARINLWTAQFALTQENYGRVAGIPLALLDDIDWEVDCALISRLTGFQVDYDHQVQPNFESPALQADLTEKDVEDLKTKMDLRWWYCKQDVFQSLVSGDPLLMPFADWKYCPPRGQIGRAHNPYATFDYLLLIMARLADFAGKDRYRKQRAVAAQGGQWKPPRWLFGPLQPPQGPVGKGKARPESAPKPARSNSGKGVAVASARSTGQMSSQPSPAPSANEGRVRQTRPGPTPGPGPILGSTSSPPMFGMMPPPSNPVQMNSALRTMDAGLKDSAFTTTQESKGSSPPRDLGDETANAFAEHASIARALDAFKESVGPEFNPLPPSESPLATPFGPPLIYRSAEVACIWAFYFVGRILLHRFQPEMPPAAMIAAGVTAHLTRDDAQTVGKICAGLYSAQQFDQSGALDPCFGGALMESTFPLLFAGVQYTDAAQRGWTISKLQDVATRCGWRTSAAIAAACEIAWEKMGEAGKAPPYVRTLNIHDKDARVNGARTRGSPARDRVEEGHTSSAEAQYESEFVHHDRTLIDRSSSTRTHWALGLLSVEDDIKRMKMEAP